MAEQTRVDVHLTRDPISVGEAYAALAGPDAGALLVFVGTTRQWTGDHETLRLEYEAYEAMAVRELGRLGEEALDRWEIARCVLVHLLGDVAVSEASVLVGVASAHRAHAFDAGRWLIDSLKERVPIWKRDHAPSGRASWVGTRSIKPLLQ